MRCRLYFLLARYSALDFKFKGGTAVVPPSDKWRPLRKLSRVTSCIGVAGVSVDGNWDACAQWVYAWLERTFYTVQKVKGGVHFHQHVLQSDDMAGEVRSEWPSSPSPGI